MVVVAGLVVAAATGLVAVGSVAVGLLVVRGLGATVVVPVVLPIVGDTAPLGVKMASGIPAMPILVGSEVVGTLVESVALTVVFGGSTGCVCHGVGVAPAIGALISVVVAGFLGVLAVVAFLVPAKLGILSLVARSLTGLELGSSNNNGKPTATAAAIAHGIPDINEEDLRGARMG